MGNSVGGDQRSSNANSLPASKSSLPNGTKPAALTAEKPSMQSPTYEQLLSDYCFYGSAPKASAFHLRSHEKTASSQAESSHDNDVHNSEAERETSTAQIHQIKIKPEQVEAGRSSKTATPRSHTPPLEERKSPSKPASGRTSRSISPANPLDSRAGSPHAFGYPYHQPMQNGFFDHTPTAIPG